MNYNLLTINQYRNLASLWRSARPGPRPTAGQNLSGRINACRAYLLSRGVQSAAFFMHSSDQLDDMLDG
ncbi:MAG: hypothetical protein ACRD10_01915, partial [Terriglobia bacterium]